MVVSLLRVPRVVPGRARSPRDNTVLQTAKPGSALPDPRLLRAPRRADRPLARDRVLVAGRAVHRATRATRSPRPCTPPACGCSRARSSTTARAAFCAARGQCPNCLVQVDGEPTVRACMTPIAEGMQVAAHQRLALARARRAARAGQGRRRASACRSASTTRRSSARGGRGSTTRSSCAAPPAWASSTPTHRRNRRFEKVHRHVDVLVIGGGQAGLEAAHRGGRATAATPRWSTRAWRWAAGWPTPGHDAADRAAELADRGPGGWASRSSSRPTPAASTRATWCPSTRATRCTASAPARSCSPPARSSSRWCSADNDLPGVMLGGAARRLVNQFRIAARRARPWW